MNPQDLIAMAKEIYIRCMGQNPAFWDKQKMARESIEAAQQFSLALQSAKEGSASPTGPWPQQNLQTELPMESTLTQVQQDLAAQSQGSHKKMDNPQDVGTSMAQQHHSGQSG